MDDYCSECDMLTTHAADCPLNLPYRVYMGQRLVAGFVDRDIALEFASEHDLRFEWMRESKIGQVGSPDGR